MERERDGEGGHSARVMVADMGVQPAVKRKQLQDEADTQARLCVQVPPRCPARFHPPSTPTSPRQPRLLSTNQGTGGRRHSGDTSKRSLGERLRADAGTTQRSTEESRDGQLEKKESKWNGKKESKQNKTFHSLHKPALCQPRIQKPRHIFLTALSQWPP
ncbi:unnamed protein product [Tetraodon nigroviridis]|uniref:(spotted green pufferfish) hypothetical protein n=1 Tax=Tetraodon nigroviridis TaxID=99883 RepID=Q4REU6_TETNG|nr:unnamed protein product [Tetraodon nigroviridis]